MTAQLDQLEALLAELNDMTLSVSDERLDQIQDRLMAALPDLLAAARALEGVAGMGWRWERGTGYVFNGNPATVANIALARLDAKGEEAA